MPTFSYTARDRAGNSLQGLIEAADSRGAAASLREQGLWPTRIDAATTSALRETPQPMSATAASVPPDLSASGFAPMAPSAAAGTVAPPSSASSTLPLTAEPTLRRSAATPYEQERMGAQEKIDAAPFLMGVPLPDLAAMYEQLGTLLNAGVPMVQALATLAEQTRHGRLRAILKEASLSVAGGNPLSLTMRRHPSTFNGLQIELIRAGEMSGMMERMCARIAQYLHREIEIRRKLKRETLYPKIVLSLAGCVLLLLTYLKAGQASTLGKAEIGAGVIAVGFAAWWVGRFLNQFAPLGAAWDYVKLLIPGPGGVARRYATARFTRALGALYGGGVLIPNAVAIAARACGNRAIGERLLAEVPRLHNGEGISGMLAASGLLSPIAVQMARTGEQTGNLDAMMDKVADYLESEADVKAHQLAVFAGVAALLLAAAVVLYIAISFYTGMFQQIMTSADK